MCVTTMGSVRFLVVLISLSSILIVLRRIKTSENSILRKRSFSQILSSPSLSSSLSVTKWGQQQQQQQQQRSSSSRRKLVKSMDRNNNQQQQNQPVLIQHYHIHNHNYYAQGPMQEQLQMVKEQVSNQIEIKKQEMQQSSSSLSGVGNGNLIGTTGSESPFPRWDVNTATSTTAAATSSSNVIDSLLDFVEQESAVFVQYPPGEEECGIAFWIHTSDIMDPIQYQKDMNLLRNNQDTTTAGKTLGQQSDAEMQEMRRKQYISRPPNWWFPEALYVVQTDGIYGSQRAMHIAGRTTEAVMKKFKPTESIMNLAHKTLVSIVQNKFTNVDNQIQKNHPNYWPRLTELLFPKNDTTTATVHSFPFLAHYGDYVGCNYRNWNEHRSSLPVFTVAATPTIQSCSHSIPFPNYRVIATAKKRSVEFDTANHLNRTYHEYYSIPYQFAEKISKVVWRGSLTGVHLTPDGTVDSIRCQLLRLLHDDTNSNTSVPFISPEDRSLFDIQVTSIPHTVQRFAEMQDPKNLRSIGWDVQDINRDQRFNIEMPTFQKYKVVLDVDGHSWSSRFFELLCYESVVLKVEPEYVDYFYYPSANRHIKQQQEHYENTHDNPFLTAPVPLQPWVHYVPVKKDFSDLVATTKYVLDEKNQQQMIQIIQNANQWCSTRIVRQALAYDVLDVWEDYIKILDGKNPPTSYNINDYNTKEQQQEQVLRNENVWSTRWEHAKSTIFAPGHPLDMQLVYNILE